MAAHRRTDRDMILGKLMCDRLALDPATTAVDFTAEAMGESMVIQTSNFHFIPKEDWAELRAIADHRAGIRGPVG